MIRNFPKTSMGETFSLVGKKGILMASILFRRVYFGGLSAERSALRIAKQSVHLLLPRSATVLPTRPTRPKRKVVPGWWWASTQHGSMSPTPLAWSTVLRGASCRAGSARPLHRVGPPCWGHADPSPALSNYRRWRRRR